MSDIVLSASVRQNLLSLQSTADLLSTTQTRLATGKKVNSALDNPTNFFTAAGLDARASDINNLLDGIGNGVQVLQAANTGITSLQKLVDTAKSIANQALQTTTGYSKKSSFTSAVISGATADNLLGTAALGTNASATGTTALGAIDLTNQQAKNAVVSGSAAITTINLTTPTPTNAKATGNIDLSGGVDASDGPITFTINTKTVTLSATGGTGGDGGEGLYTQADLEDAINSTAGVGVVASHDTDGNLVLTSSGTVGATDEIVTTGLTDLGIADNTFSGSDGVPEDLTFDVNGKTVTLAAGSDYDGTAIAAAINQQVGAAADANVTASYASGKLVITSNGTAGVGDTLKIDNFTGGDVTQLGFANLAAADKTGSDATTASDLTFNVNGKQVKLDAGKSYSATEVVKAINDQVGTTASVKASLDNSGNLVVTSTGTANADDEVTIDTFSSGDATQFGLATAAVDAKNGVDPAPSSINGLTLKIDSTGGGTATSITFGDGNNGTVNTLNQLNAALADNHLQASIGTDGTITITTSNDYASSKIGTVSGTAADTGGTFNGAAPADATVDPVAQSTRANLVTQYNNVIDQIRTTAQDASFNGVNLLNGDQLKLVFNETGKSTLNITGVDFNPAGLGLGTLNPGIDFIDNAATNKVLASLNDASSTLRGQASALGSNLSIVQIRQDFSKNLINVLQTGSSNLTLADTNEEAANSQALATRQSIAVSALALANQSQQSVLQLLR